MVALPENDPAYWMLQRGQHDVSWQSQPVEGLYRDNCYICRDPEFALMGMSLCYPCPVCKGHVPADDVECENGHDAQEWHETQGGS